MDLSSRSMTRDVTTPGTIRAGGQFFRPYNDSGEADPSSLLVARARSLHADTTPPGPGIASSASGAGTTGSTSTQLRPLSLARFSAATATSLICS